MAQTTVESAGAFPLSGMLRKAVALMAAVAVGIGIALVVSRGPAEVPAVDSAGGGGTAPAVASLRDDFGTRHLAGFSGEIPQDAWKEDFATRRYLPQG